MKKHSSVLKQSESSRKVERRDTREVMSELVAQLQKQVDRKQEPGRRRKYLQPSVRTLIE